MRTIERELYFDPALGVARVLLSEGDTGASLRLWLNPRGCALTFDGLEGCALRGRDATGAPSGTELTLMAPDEPGVGMYAADVPAGFLAGLPMGWNAYNLEASTEGGLIVSNQLAIGVEARATTPMSDRHP